MQNPIPSDGDFFEDLWRELEIEFWRTMASQATSKTLKAAYWQKMFYAATQP